MKISKRQLMEIINNSILNEVGPGPGMDPTGATMPIGMKRSEYNQLGDASADPQYILAALSVLPPAFVPAMVASAILYYLDGETEEAAQTLALTAIVGGVSIALSKGIPAIRAAFKSSGLKNPAAAAAADDLINQANKVKPNTKPPPPHPKTPKVAHRVIDPIPRSKTRPKVWNTSTGRVYYNGGHHLELQFGGNKKIDFYFRYLPSGVTGETTKTAIEKLSRTGKTLGSIKGLPEVIYKYGHASGPSIEQLSKMKVHFENVF